MTLTLPAVAEPQVTIAMALHDAPDWTRRAIEALIANTPPVYELSIVDDASRQAETATLLAGLSGARVERNDPGEGFGPASNRAAAGAHGEHILFLNSDALVQPGWLDPMLARMQDPATGAVAPMLLNVDGTVQQAGAVITRDGSTLIYGYGSSPDAPHVAFARIIDYAAAACLLIRREVFDSLGGFDPIFAPAYYEDTDLCLRVAGQGLRTVYEPTSRVVHGLGKSYDGKVDNDAFAGNRERFVDRWHTLLDARPTVLDNARPWLTVAARDAPAVIRLLVLGEVPRDTGTRLATEVPGAHVTIASAAVDPADGVEILRLDPQSVPELLRDRRFHYEALLTDTSPTGDIEASIDRWQPQAVRLSVVDALVPGGLVAAGLY